MTTDNVNDSSQPPVLSEPLVALDKWISASNCFLFSPRKHLATPHGTREASPGTEDSREKDFVCPCHSGSAAAAPSDPAVGRSGHVQMDEGQAGELL